MQTLLARTKWLSRLDLTKTYIFQWLLKFFILKMYACLFAT